MIHTPDGDARYTRWRATIPFTDAQIVEALERYAHDSPPNSEWMREHWAHMRQWVSQGHLTSRILGWALPYLVQRCGICGKTALYRYGNSGRCKVHKHITTVAWEQHRRVCLERAAALDAWQNNKDRDAKLGDFKRRLHKGRQQKNRQL